MIQTTPRTLSVIVVTRNTSDLLLNCLKQIYESDLSMKLEVIVVDNGSSDGSAAMVRSHFPQVILIEAGCNLGFARANNLAFQNSTGEYILLVNTDAMLEKECASRLVGVMEKDRSVGMVGPQLLNSDGSRQTSFEATPTLLTELVGRGVLKIFFPKRYPGRKVELRVPEEVETLIGAVILIRRTAWKSVQGFDEGYFFFFEETDMALRMRQSGWTVYHNPLARSVHLQGATAKNYNAAPRIEYYRSRYLFFRKMYGRASELALKVALTLNLTLNTLVLGMVALVCLGKSRKLNDRYFQRSAIWLWHVRGFPSSAGLPRN